ncbi:antitoxin [Nakamurella sp. YIM 132087]|uniref:Antitoxin n=1 Tax=Nakamurella alba TaxID=2665158 RepID=A0A7K1FRV6_9ACTN|nr:antitoxin [Nakamurella alba]MTD16871.1 antitoxin [Nakamurella alba]
MKISVSLTGFDLATVDAYARNQGLTRSAALHHVIAVFRRAQLAQDYEIAIDEWIDSGDAALWDRTAGDGIEADPVYGSSSVRPQASGA